MGQYMNVGMAKATAPTIMAVTNPGNVRCVSIAMHGTPAATSASAK